MPGKMYLLRAIDIGFYRGNVTKSFTLRQSLSVGTPSVRNTEWQMGLVSLKGDNIEVLLYWFLGSNHIGYVLVYNWGFNFNLRITSSNI